MVNVGEWCPMIICSCGSGMPPTAQRVPKLRRNSWTQSGVIFTRLVAGLLMHFHTFRLLGSPTSLRFDHDAWKERSRWAGTGDHDGTELVITMRGMRTNTSGA